jgi:hypothetical protein
VDAVLVMESIRAGRWQELAALAALDQMEAAVRLWATARGGRPGEPALVLICPVKCETYFADNGGARDMSAELRGKVLDVYAEMLGTLREAAPEARILYVPVDTIGCVELTGVTWGSGLDLRASYRIRQPERISRAGAKDVVWGLYRHLFQVRRAALAADTKSAGRRPGELDEVLRGAGGPVHGPRVRDLSHRMRLHVRTRGLVRDYQFIGEPPDSAWWRSYADVTDLEEPTVLVESDGQTWRAYVSGLPSRRQDMYSRAISYDLVMHGECNPAEGDDHDLALAVIATVVRDLAQGSWGERGPLSRLPVLGQASIHEESVVERWVSQPEASAAAQAAVAVREAFTGFTDDGLAVANSLDRDSGYQRWIGGLANDTSRAEFIALTGRLIGGAVGRALMLSYVAEPRDVEAVAPGDGDLGILVSRHGPGYDAEPIELPQLGSAL